MTLKEAYLLATDDMEGWTVDRCFEYESIFVFHMIPNGFHKQNEELFDCMRSVNKKTKLVRHFQPFHIPVEEYNNGKEIFDFKMDNELRHYGILGMKWGIRRTEAQLARARGKVSELEDKLNKKTGGKSSSPSTDTAPKKKSIKDMSDEELRAKINRLQMEKQLEQLEGSNVKDKGKSAVGGFLKTAGKKILVDTAVDITAQAVKHYMAEFTNKKIGKTERVKNPETEQWEDVLKDVVATNNKKK